MKMSKLSKDNFSAKEAAQKPVASQLAGKTSNPLSHNSRGFRSKKYISAQKFYTEIEMDKLHNDHPDWELKDILAEIIKNFPAEMPSDVILTMTKFIVETWEKAIILETETA